VTSVRTDIDAPRRGVARITISRPERKNAFDAAIIAEITTAAKGIPEDCRAVVLASEGDVFCAGADLTWMKSTAGQSLDANIADSRAMSDMYRSLDELPMPLVIRVQGAALGGGAGLVALADIGVASTAASFGFSEVRVGIMPSVVSPYVVRRIGPGHAGALFLSGIRFDAAHAREIGLVDDVVPPEELDAKVASYLDAIVAGAPGAIRAAKQLVRDVAGRPIAEVRERTITGIARLRVSDEGQEGMRAFLERRKPSWDR
jgi:methylglutaconyl-CoA hydratase